MNKIVLKVWVIIGLNVVDVSICEVELRGCFLLTESKDYMNTASYEYRNMWARRGAMFVPMGVRRPRKCRQLETREH